MKSIVLVIMLMVPSFKMALADVRLAATAETIAVQRAVAPRLSTAFALLDKQRSPSVNVNVPGSGLLGSLLIAGGVASLFSLIPDNTFFTEHTGLLVLGFLILFFVARAWRHGKGNPQYQYDWETYVPEIDAPDVGARIDSAGLQLPLNQNNQLMYAVDAGGGQAVLIPDFDASMFVSHAKTHFVNLQVAWDQGDFNRIQHLTTPTMFRALRQQAQSVIPGARHTDVVQLFCTLLHVHTTGKEYIASVSFEGLMKAMPDASAEVFSEMWHITRPLGEGATWSLAGIQKIS